jgi:hypothetical protein
MTANLARALAAQGRDDEALEQAILSGELAVRDDLYAQVERRGPLAAVLARRGRLARPRRGRRGRPARRRQRHAGYAGRRPARPGRGAAPGRPADEGRPLARRALELAGRKGHTVAAAQARELLDA